MLAGSCQLSQQATIIEKCATVSLWATVRLEFIFFHESSDWREVEPFSAGYRLCSAGGKFKSYDQLSFTVRTKCNDYHVHTNI